MSDVTASYGTLLEFITVFGYFLYIIDDCITEGRKSDFPKKYGQK